MEQRSVAFGNRTRKGNRWLRRALCQAAWAATRKKLSCAFFFRKAGKQGQRKAIVATAHHILIVAFCLHPDRTRNRLVRGLQRLGLDVQLRPRRSNPATTLPAANLAGLPSKRRPGLPCIHNTLSN